MIPAWICRVLFLSCGTLYPAYRSYKAVKTKNVREYVKWMMYWIVFAIFLALETFTDVFVAFWLPFYNEFKVLYLVWLLSPYTKGASVIYRKFVHPALEKHEREIDSYLKQAKNQSYDAFVRMGYRGVNYAKELVATAAVKGQAQLLNQITKSYSLNDVTDSVNNSTNTPGELVRSLSTVESSGYTPSDELDQQENSQDLVDREFGYLDDDWEDEPLLVRVKKQQHPIKSTPKHQHESKDDSAAVKPRGPIRRGKNTEGDLYGTMPRRSNRVANKTNK